MEFFATTHAKDSDFGDSDTENDACNGVFKLPPHLAARLQQRNDARKKNATEQQIAPLAPSGDETRPILSNLTNASQILDEPPKQERNNQKTFAVEPQCIQSASKMETRDADDSDLDDSNTENDADNGVFKLPPRLAARLQERNDARKKIAAERQMAQLMSLGEETRPILNNASQKLDEPQQPVFHDRRQTMLKQQLMLNRRQTMLIRVNKAPLKEAIPATPISCKQETFQSEQYYADFINSVIATSFDLEKTKFNPAAIMNSNPSSMATTTSMQKPLKDGISKQAYKEQAALDRLRKKAASFYHSEDMKAVQEMLTTEMKHIKRFHIRKDQSVRDVGMKKKLLEIFSNYNPLWLKVAVETVFGIEISKFNAAAVAQTLLLHLITFNKMATDRGCSSVSVFFMKDKYKEMAATHVLYHFLMLVHFMDVGKQRRLIDHDPCLFRVDIPSDQKCSRQSVVDFASLYVTGVGNIIAALSNVGIHLEHSQKPIEEFNFSVTNLGQDLLCGVRLARLVEIILQRNDILCRLLYPSENRTRKFHNMGIIFKFLEPHLAQSHIDVTSRDIVEGKRVKILTFLDELVKLHQTRQCLLQMSNQQEKVVIIQRWWRRHLSVKAERYNFLAKLKAAITIQQYLRVTRVARVVRQEFVTKRKAVITIQRRYRAILLGRAALKDFLAKRNAAITIQQHYRAVLVSRRVRIDFVAKRKAAITIQQHYRAILLRRPARKEFLAKRQAAIAIQKHYRAIRLARLLRHEFVVKREAAIKIQQNYRAILAARPVRQDYLAQRNAAIVLQQHLRAALVARVVRQEFVAKRKAAITIQQHYRAMVVGRAIRRKFIAQQKAAIVIQQHYRAILAARPVRQEFLAKRKAASIIQQHYRSTLVARVIRREFVVKRQAAITIQQHYRAIVLGRVIRQEFVAQQKAAIVIQQHYRAILLARPVREEYLAQRNAAITIQQHLRATLVARVVRQEFVAKRKAATTIQQHYRAMVVGRSARKVFVTQQKAALVIQQHYRAILLARPVRQKFLAKRKAASIIQQHYRSTLVARAIRREFVAKRQATIKIQQHYRAILVGRSVRKEFMVQKQAAIKLQRAWREHQRGTRLKRAVLSYVELCHKASTIIQRHWKGYITRRRMGPIFEERRRLLALAAERVTEEKKLINIVKDIIQNIPNATRMETLEKHLRHLQYATDNSNEVCQYLLTQPMLIAILVNLLGNLNRSEPHKLMMINILLIFHLIIVKNENAVQAIFANEGLVPLLAGFLKNFLRSPNVLKPTVKLMKLYLKALPKKDPKLLELLHAAEGKLRIKVK